MPPQIASASDAIGQTATPRRVGVLEDNPHTRSMIERFLVTHGFFPVPLSSGDQARTAAERGAIDLLMLDLGLPGEEGMEVLQGLRSVSRIPVLIVSGRRETASIAAGLDAGADDYLIKPVAFDELGARLRSILRRAQSTPETRSPSRLSLGDAELDLETHSLTGPSGQQLLTERESLIVSLLHSAAGKVVSRATLTRVTLGQNTEVWGRTLDVHVSNIRKKLRLAGCRRPSILTARNIGYYLAPSLFGDGPSS